jgi:hypothetical protein
VFGISLFKTDHRLCLQTLILLLAEVEGKRVRERERGIEKRETGGVRSEENG